MAIFQIKQIGTYPYYLFPCEWWRKTVNKLQAGFARSNINPMLGIQVRGYFKERIGYFPTMNAYEESGYEALSSRFKAGVAERIVEGAKKLLGMLKEG